MRLREMMRLRSSTPSVATHVSVLALAGLLVTPGLGAQQTAPPPQVQVGLPQLETSAATRRILLEAGKSTRITTDFDIETVAVTTEDVASVQAITNREVVLHGRAAGTVSFMLWGGGRFEHYEVVVDPGVAQLEQALAALFPTEDVQVTVNEGAIILSGAVSNNTTFLRIAEIAQASMPDARVINMLQLPGGAGSQQVSLQVRVAEVNRRAIEELGLNLFVSRQNFVTRATTEQFPAPTFEEDDIVFADFLNVFFFQRNEGIGGVLRALRQNGWFESLAEPNLIAYNNEEASFLAGGEFPIPVVSGSAGQVTIDYKEYGVKLNFTPQIAGDVIRLSVDPEVSNLDFANGVTIGGFRIPALIVRRAHTVVELRDGQSFAIAGLLDTINQEDRAAIPILSQIPIIGPIFRSRARRETQTELMVLVTPRLVRPLNPDEVPPLPSIIRPPAGGGGGGGLMDPPAGGSAGAGSD